MADFASTERGKSIRLRWRLAAVAGAVAFVVAALAVYLALTRRQPPLAVTSVGLRLDDGQQLRLIPVQRYGYRLVAYVIPRQVGIASATAYLNNGQYETTIPSNSEGLSFFPPWLWHGPRGH
jgi:hypothetical protein